MRTRPSSSSRAAVGAAPAPTRAPLPGPLSRPSTRRRALVIRHVPSEGLGLLGPPLRRRGVRGVRLDVFRGHEIPRTLPPGMMLIVLGGPYGARDTVHARSMQAEMRLIGDCLDRGTPVLGVCLGAELLARAAGGKVARALQPEVGWYPVELTPDGESDPVTGALPPRFVPLHWHADELTPPRDARTLARSQFVEHEAFTLGPTAYGMLFHIDPTTSMIRAWLRDGKRDLPDNEHERLRLLRETPLHAGALSDLCERFVGRFLEQALRPPATAEERGAWSDLDAGRGLGH